MPFAVASQISPSGMTLAGKHGIGIISVGSTSTEGLTALPMQWSFAEEAAAKPGQVVDRTNWRVVLSWHIAATREKSAEQAGRGLLSLHHEHNLGHPQRTGTKPCHYPADGGGHHQPPRTTRRPTTPHHTLVPPV